MNNKVKAISPDHEIVNSRVVDAPIDLVYRAWSEPGHLQNWWGPAGFTNTFYEFDFRVGGRWRFTMHGPEKGNYQNECEFVQIDPPSVIAWTRITQPYFQVLATFEEVSPNKTAVGFHQVFDTVEACNKLKPFVVDKNEENLDRLEEELKKMGRV